MMAKQSQEEMKILKYIRLQKFKAEDNGRTFDAQMFQRSANKINELQSVINEQKKMLLRLRLERGFLGWLYCHTDYEDEFKKLTQPLEDAAEAAKEANNA